MSTIQEITYRQKCLFNLLMIKTRAKYEHSTILGSLAFVMYWPKCNNRNNCFAPAKFSSSGLNCHTVLYKDLLPKEEDIRTK